MGLIFGTILLNYIIESLLSSRDSLVVWTNYQYFFSFKIRCKNKLSEIKTKIKIV